MDSDKRNNTAFRQAQCTAGETTTTKKFIYVSSFEISQKNAQQINYWIELLAFLKYERVDQEYLKELLNTRNQIRLE
ncbi:MAG TPA: hypothetical protein ENI61_06880 [Ignavibacteria bacterium]|nr:hypothetical protein [Ignavibacteria bacterium]